MTSIFENYEEYCLIVILHNFMGRRKRSSDNILNVLDVILLVNLILSQQYNDIADFNNDQVLNVLDVITLINIILE